MRRVLLSLLPAFVLAASGANADTLPPPMPTMGTVNAVQCTDLDVRCQRGHFTVSKSEKIAADFDYDTGWLPSGAAVQVRLVSYLHGRTRVDMSGSVDATWPDAIRLRPEGLRAAGLLAIDDGIVVKAMARFKVNVAGKDYAWTGDIPGVPKVDLASVSSVKFDPWAWKGAPMPPQTSGKTMQMELWKAPLTDAIIPIPGIEGGFQLEGQGEFFAEYNTLRIAFDELTSKGAIGDVDPTTAFTRVLFSSAPALDSSVFIHGELTRQTTLHFIPGLYFSILGKKFDLELIDIPVAIPKSTKPWDFDPVAMHFPLPRIEARPNPIDLGTIPVGQPTSILVTAFDTGEAKLVIDARVGEALAAASDPTSVLTIDTKHIEIGGGSSDAVRATLTPTTDGPIDTTLVLESNDPLKPKLSIRITANGAGAAAGDPTTEAAGGCGCHTTSTTNTGAGFTALAVALIALRRRPRSPSAHA